MFVIKVVGLVNGIKTSHDGQFLLHYEPVLARLGQPFMKTCGSPERALYFNDFEEAMEYVMRSVGVRDDGHPDRPIRAFSLEMIPESELVSLAGYVSR